MKLDAAEIMGRTVEQAAKVIASRDDTIAKLRARIAELEAALREIAGGEISAYGEIVVRSDSMRIAHEALEQTRR